VFPPTAPLRNAPFGGAQVAIATSTATGRDRQSPPEWQRDWELDPDWDFNGNGDRDSVPAPTSRAFDDLYPVDSGNPLPKSKGAEMDKQFGDNYFSPYPEWFGRQWQLQHLKQLQVQHKWQSPPAAEVKAKRAPPKWPPDDEEQPPPFDYVYNLPWKRKDLPESLRYLPSISAGEYGVGLRIEIGEVSEELNIQLQSNPRLFSPVYQFPRSKKTSSSNSTQLHLYRNSVVKITNFQDDFAVHKQISIGFPLDSGTLHRMIHYCKHFI